VLVSRDVSFNLLNPVASVMNSSHLRLKRRKAALPPLPAVPKISIHENRNLPSAKHQIGPPRDAWDANPEPKTETMESASQISLGLRVFTTNIPHRARDNGRVSRVSLCFRHYDATVAPIGQ